MEIVEYLFIGLAYLAVVGFLISGLDDLLFDSHFLIYLFRTRKHSHVSIQDLRLQPEQWIAIFVPAWQEGGIANKMAEHATRVLLYEKYDIFIGVYPNDPETIKCVDEICAQNPRLHKVLVPHPGPTCKADCLNWIYRAMLLNEIPGTREYKILALHDAEDVLHPLLLKVYNYFIPKTYDMGQVPVFALELPVLKYWTGNTYIDDFAELHTKDLFVRESIGGVVPSAGVGTGFARPALDRLAGENGGEPFLLGNLTEDYEVGIRLKRAGYRAGMISVPVDRIIRRKRKDGSDAPPKTVSEIVAVRECFPNTFKTAVRQRSRWILGISFQTWEQAGWRGTLPMRYTLLRDRRAPLTHLINMVGYLVLLYALAAWLFRNSSWAQNIYLRPLFIPDSLLWKVVLIDTWLLGYRAVQKFISVWSIYNLKQAVFSLPRMVLNNFINFAATARAAKMYLAHKFFKQPIVWHKTAHVFPTESELAEYTETIEDLLVEQGLATREQIFQALKLQQGSSAPLSLFRMGLLPEKDFTEVWSKYSRLPVTLIDPARLPAELLQRFPESKSMELEALPFGVQNGKLQFGFREPPTQNALRHLQQLFERDLESHLVRPSNLAWARTRAYTKLILPPSPFDSSAEHFRAAACMDSLTLIETLSRAHWAGQSLPDLLVNSGQMPAPDARRLWADAIGFPPLDIRTFSPHQETYFKVGPSFWWLHKMLPLSAISVATAHRPHPLMVEWITAKMGVRPNLVAELPGKVTLAGRNRGIEIDPDQVLLDCLVAKGHIKTSDVPNLKALRQMIKDPLPTWLRLQALATEEQLYQVFRQICDLPEATSWKAEDVQRLAPALPPGFAKEHACYLLEETAGALRLGLAQMLSPAALQELYARLAGYPLAFQALSYEDSGSLRELI